ncbi:MAG: hypothetical protein DI536_03830 [Archangium gephyra]|uniref:Cytochrome c domain-containing protein n=1 Tax=Archangium gephyra TaxID=48 RepID=A0A2W5W2T6_9BACT|nr:MAG: hypothetical protein DI536_03830 [Archangium gephyra]
MKKLIYGVATAALLSTSGCGEMMPPGDPELTCATAPQSATLASNVQAVFDAKCKDCHEAQYAYGDYTTAEKTLAATTDKKSVYAGRNATLMVVDGANKSLANSALWLKVLGGAAAGRTGPKGENVQGKMPNDNRELTAQEKQLIKDWICTGGK